MAVSKRNLIGDNENSAQSILEQPVVKKEKKQASEDDVLKEYAEELQGKKKNKKVPDVYVFKLLGYDAHKVPPRYISVSNEMPIFDEEEGRLRTIRLVKGVSSIFVDEQKDVTPQFLQRNKLDIVFNNGYLRVPSTNTTFVEFLFNSDEYDGKTHRMRAKKPKFTLVNTDETDENELDMAELQFKALEYALTASVEDMLPHAKFLGIDFVGDFGEKSAKKIRVEYAEKAKAKPSYFMQTANSPYVKASFIVGQAINNGVIDVTTKKGYAVWKGTTNAIAEIPFGASAVDTIAKLCLSDTEEGKLVYSQLKRSLVS